MHVLCSLPQDYDYDILIMTIRPSKLLVAIDFMYLDQYSEYSVVMIAYKPANTKPSAALTQRNTDSTKTKHPT